jgi:beta-glucosidase
VSRGPDSAGGAITVVLDDPVTGAVLGTVAVLPTASKYAYTTVTGPLSGATGRHDVYLVFTGNLNLETFSLGQLS